MSDMTNEQRQAADRAEGVKAELAAAEAAGNTDVVAACKAELARLAVPETADDGPTEKRGAKPKAEEA